MIGNIPTNLFYHSKNTNSYEKHLQNNQLQPNSPTAQQPNSPTAQQPKLNLLLKYCNSRFGLLCLLFTFFHQQALSAQSFSATDQVILTVENGFNSGEGARGFAFIPNSTIFITEIGLRTPDISTPFEFVIWERGTSTKVHQQTITISTVGVYEYFPVTAPITLTSGVEYISTFYAPNGTGYYYGDNNSQINANLTYQEVVFCNNCNTSTMPISTIQNAHYGVADFMFQLTPPASSNTDVPTLSEWGLIILALLLMTLGTLYLVQPKFRGGIFEQER